MPGWMERILFDEPLLWVVVSGLLCAAVVALLCLTAVKRRQKKWNSLWFFILCGVALVWSGAALLEYLSQVGFFNTPVAALHMMRTLGMLFVPGLIYLHIYKQVSYRDIQWYSLAVCLGVPALLFFILCARAAAGMRMATLQTSVGGLAALAVFCLYFLGMMLRALLQLLRVFYQMPTHMRRPAGYMMAGVFSFAAAGLLQARMGPYLPYDVMLVAIVVVLRVFYHAFGLVSSANVIVTSRELVLENLSTMVLVLNPNGRILDWNTRARHLLPHLLQPRYQEGYAYYRQRLLAQAGGRVSPHDENILTFPDGDGEVHYMISTRQLYTKKRQLGFLVEISGVTKIYSVFRALEETATVDQLTGLYNRNAYLQRIGLLMTQENVPLLVLVGDVNNLKPTNDIYGHLAGDALLVNVAQMIRKCAPSPCFAARIGGDEFVVLVPHSDEKQAEAFIQGVSAGCAALQQNGGVNVGVSWGYAVMTSPHEDYNEVFGAADKMMYATKKQHARFRSSGLVPESPAEAAEPPMPTASPPPTEPPEAVRSPGPGTQPSCSGDAPPPPP